MQAKEYDILMAPSADELIGHVNEAIKEGWQPIGGVSVVAEYDHDYWDYTQAIVRVVDDPLEV